MRLRETMRARHAPDVYVGPNCDRHESRWMGSAEGDMDGDGPVGREGTLMLSARTFPPGTVVTVSMPECPNCHETPHDMGDLPDGKGGWFTKWKCGCDFDWHEWASEEFS